MGTSHSSKNDSCLVLKKNKYSNKITKTLYNLVELYNPIMPFIFKATNILNSLDFPDGSIVTPMSLKNKWKNKIGGVNLDNRLYSINQSFPTRFLTQLNAFQKDTTKKLNVLLDDIKEEPNKTCIEITEMSRMKEKYEKHIKKIKKLLEVMNRASFKFSKKYNCSNNTLSLTNDIDIGNSKEDFGKGECRELLKHTLKGGLEKKYYIMREFFYYYIDIYYLICVLAMVHSDDFAFYDFAKPKNIEKNDLETIFHITVEKLVAMSPNIAQESLFLSQYKHLANQICKDFFTTSVKDLQNKVFDSSGDLKDTHNFKKGTQFSLLRLRFIN